MTGQMEDTLILPTERAQGPLRWRLQITAIDYLCLNSSLDMNFWATAGLDTP